MWCRSSIYFLLAVIVTGCGGSGEAKKTPSLPENKNQPTVEKQVDVSAPRAVEQVAPKPVIYSCQELAKVLDLGALPVLEGTAFENKSAARVSAQVPGTVTEVSAFYQKNLLALDWELVPDPDRKNTDEYASLRFAKDGHRASLEISTYDIPKKKGPRTLVSMVFHSNLDTRALPPPAGCKLLFASQTGTSYLTENTVAEAALWVAKALPAEGWQKFATFDASKDDTGDFRTLHYRKQGYALTIFVGPNPRFKKTHIQYSVAALGHELPTPPEAARVQFDDVQWKLRCEVPGDWKAAADFYQKAMPATGCHPLPGEDPRPTYWNLRFGTDAGDLIMVQVASKDRQITQVSMDGIPAAVLAAMKKRDEAKKTSKK